MPRKLFRSILLTLSCLGVGMSPSGLSAQTAYGTTSAGQLIRFDLATPGTVNLLASITGLGVGETIVGIDFRPATSQLYGLGSQNRIYVIDTATATATQVGANGAFTLAGSAFGFDFNPTVDRIRVVSDTEQNLRLNPSTGALAAADSTLSYAVGDVNFGANPNVVGSAYTNSLPGAPTTTLYSIDTNLDVLVIQNPANSGVLNTVGSLGVDASNALGFDTVIWRGANSAYAALQVGGSSRLYDVNLTTGAATQVGSFPAGMVVTGLAIPPDPARLVNISTRAQVLTGNDVMIGGFVIGGSLNRTVAIVATGPSLAAFGIANPLANPTLTLVRSSDQAVLATNNDWQTASNAAQLQAAGFAPSNALEAAILVNLPPGGYTAIVEGVGGGTGVSVIGAYDVDAISVTLTNISTRARVLTGNDVMIGGFVVTGEGPLRVAIVATGPSLAAFGITNPLANPTISLVRSSDQAVIESNDDWQTHANAAQLQTAGFAPTNPLESGIYTTLPPGAYTVIVEGVGGGTGVSVIGVYQAP